MKAIHSWHEVRGQRDKVCSALLDATLRSGYLTLTNVLCSADESGDQQQDWPEAAHCGQGGEALSPSASGSPHPCPCRARRGEWTGLRKARTGVVRASSRLPLLLPLLPHFGLLALLLGCAGALKHSCCVLRNEGRSGRLRAKQSTATSQSNDTFSELHSPA